jgi:hypothetical protein
VLSIRPRRSFTLFRRAQDDINAVVVLFLFVFIGSGFSGDWSIPFGEFESRSARQIGLFYPESGMSLSDQTYRFGEAAAGLKALHSRLRDPLLIYGIRDLKAGLQAFQSGESRVYARVRNRLYWRDKEDEAVRFVGDLYLGAHIDSRLTAFFDFEFDTDGLYDSDYHGVYEWKDVTGDFRLGAIRYQSDKWSLQIGRDAVHWGPGFTGSLLTSGFAPALDMIQFSADIRRFRFQAFNAMLVRAGRQEGRDKLNRYFSGHRLSARFGRTELGLHETVMTGGPGEVIHPLFFNPLFPYYFSDVMQSEERGDNITLAFDASFYPARSFRLYSQFTVDEFYYEKEHYPNRIGWLAGFDWMSPFGRGSGVLHAEYVKIDRWVYNYEAESYWVRLNYFNSILGHPIGPDGDLLAFSHESSPVNDVYLQVQGGLRRKGETTVFTYLDTDEQLEQHHPPFPFGIVEKTTFAGIDLEWKIFRNCRLTGQWSGDWISNFSHVKGENKNESRWKAGLVLDVGGSI